MNIEKLKESGIDYEEGLERFSGNMGLYEKYLNKLLTNTLYEDLKAALSENNVEEAFSCAHKLKGFLGNLSINGLYHHICQLTEVLRAGNTPSDDMISGLNGEYAVIISAIKGDTQ